MIGRIYQNRRFKKLSKEYPSIYKKLKKLGSEPFVMPFWSSVNEKAYKSFLPTPDIKFLSNRAIVDTMFVVGDENWLNTQIDYLKNHYKKDFKKVIREDRIGNPKLVKSLGSSHNTIHHLYHFLFFEEVSKSKLKNISTIVEWGGGYGNMAKLWKKYFNSNGTYIIIDTALFASVQWLYLSAVLGPQSVNLLSSKKAKIVNGKINIVPLALLDQTDIKGDLFLSTWGLSESKREAQDYVVKRKWFGADHLLIGFQDSTTDLKYASRLGEIAHKDGAKIIDIEFIPNNHYAIK